MFIPPNPGNDNDKMSEKPIPAMKPHATPGPDGASAGNVPQGEDLVNYVIECLDKGSSKPEVRKQLIAFGYSATDAEQAVEDAAEWRRRNGSNYPDAPVIANAAASGGYSPNANMLIGGGICLLGLVITIGSCLAAGEGGGRYYIAYGAIIWGAIQFFRGLSQSNES
jgi:hypothetical protein